MKKFIFISAGLFVFAMGELATANSLCGSSGEINGAASTLNLQLQSVGINPGSATLQLFQTGPGFSTPSSACISFKIGYYRAKVVCGYGPTLDSATYGLNQQTGQLAQFASATSEAPDRQHAAYACSVILL